LLLFVIVYTILQYVVFCAMKETHIWAVTFIIIDILFISSCYLLSGTVLPP
jgi:hypothetical protein